MCQSHLPPVGRVWIMPLKEICLGDYSYRVGNALLGSALLPASLRTRVMRLAGFDISRKTTIWAGANLRSKRIRMGPGVFVNVGFYHDGYDWLEVGCNVRIGPYVRILTATHNIGPPHQRCLIEVVGMPVRIGDGCWIGAGVTIMPGVTIAEGCVIGATSLVLKSTEPNGLYAGTPARRIRDLECPGNDPLSEQACGPAVTGLVGVG